jgi:fimbrial isopeptide formation D2 family protein
MNSSQFLRFTTRVVSIFLLTLASSIAIAQVCTPPANKNTNFIGNAYYPGSGQAAAGQKVLSVGTVRALQGGTGPDGSAWAQTTTTIAAGDLLFIIQMQDATISNTDDDTYGDGVAGGFGQGSNNLRNVGRYEFGVVASVAGNAITLRDNLQYEYNTSGATSTQTRRSFQVIRVNQNSNLTLPGDRSVIPWDGSTGGVIVFDVAGTLNFNGAKINADAAGFRGGGSQVGANSTGDQPVNYRDLTNNTNNYGGMKGEGIAGTPRLVRGTAATAFNGVASGLLAGDEGYPGTFDRSRGAPGNAGGGGNQHNAGGGGGSNSGEGGKGGYSFAFYSVDPSTAQCGNGNPARTFPASSDQDPAAPNGTYYACGGDGARDVGGNPGGVVAPSADRVILGGGGGAGDNNNASDNATTPQASGGNGGGLIFVRASAVSGSGTLTANGEAGQPSGRDGAGGGGSGGTIALAIPNTVSTLSLTLTAQGGKGGDSGLPLRANESQGPGGAGGGGSVLKPTSVSFSTPPNISGGTEGLNRPVTGVANPYGTQAGGGQLGSIDYQPNNLPNSNACYAPNVSKTTSTPIRVQGQQTTATYTVTLTQPSNRFQISGVNIVDNLPAPFNVAAGTNATITYAGGSSGPATLPATGSGAGPFDPVTFGVAGGTAANSFTLPPNSSVTITFTVNVNGAPAGTYANSVTVNSRNSESNLPVVSGPASANVTVIDPPGLTKAFSPAFITPGATSRLTITLTNPTGTVANLTSALVDSLPAGVVLAATPNLATTCSGTGAVTSAAGPPVTITLPATRSIPANGSCTVTADVTSSTPGVATNSIPAGALQTDRGAGPAASAPLTVIEPTKSVRVLTDADASGAPSVGDTLRYTLTYTSPAGAPTITNFQIFDILPTGVTKLTGAGNGVAVTVSGAGTAATEDTAYTGVAPTSSLLQSGATLAAGGTITVTIDATINSGVAAGTNLDNTARASGSGLPAVTGNGTGGGIPTDADATPSGSLPQPQDTPTATEPTRVTLGSTPRAITGKVYRDLDKNGAQNGTEPGLGGVTVTLKDSGGNVLATTTTAADGTYTFPNRAPGTYTVEETQPAGFGSSETPTNTASVTVPVAGTTPIAGPNFGEIAGSVSGTVYRDDNNDGAKAGTEPGLSGIQVQLLDSGGNPVDTDPVTAGVQSTATTDANGNYSFPNVPGGTGYRVVETQPTGYLDGRETAGTAGGTVPTTTGSTPADNTITGINVPTPVSTASSDPSNATGYLFGERGQTVTGKVYLDQDRNNAQNGSDPGLSGVTVTIRDSGNNVVGTAVTAADGTYTFPNLAPGTYTVTETQPTGYGSSETPSNTASVTVPAVATPTGTVAGPNFGDTLGSLSGRVFRDPNNDGVQSGAAETGIEGVQLEVLDGTGNPVDTDPVTSGVQSTVLTDVNGNYTLPNLPAGTYRIRETQPPCCTDGKEVAGTANGTIPTTTGSDPASNTITAINLPTATQATGYNFAELPLVGINGTVFNDRDRDGTQDAGETGIPGVTITLKDNLGNDIDSDGNPGNGVQPTTTVTGPGGTYSFPNLPAGTYQVVETQPTGYGSSAATPNTQSVTIAAGGSGTVNFGDTLSTLSGTVYRDNNDSGTKQPNEAGISGVTITVKDNSGNDIDSDPVASGVQPTTAVTDANGNYTIRDLPQGTYQIVETQPAAFVDGKETAGSSGGTPPTTTGNDPASNTIAGVTVGAGVDATGYLFGERGTPINGTVFRDDDRDGTKDAGEPGLAGVPIELRDSAGNPIDSDPSTPAIEPTTTTTDANGNYSFPNVPAGSYQVVETTQPAGYGSSTPNTVPVTVVTGTPSTVNFGETLGRISGSVYNDANDNGLKDAGEAGLAGVTVTLKDNAGNDIDSDPATNGVQPTTAITDATGNYSFDKLPVGTYRVVETQPTGIQDGKDTVGTAGGTTTVNDEIRGITLTPGLDATGYLFGEKAPTGTVIGRIFRDDNGNGSQGSSEPGLAGVQVRITNGAFTTIVTTDANGNYSAPGVPVGTATVDVIDSTLPAGVTQTAGVDPSAVTVLLNQTTDAGADGYRLPPPVATSNSATTPIDTPVTFPITGDDSSAPGTTIDPSSVDLDPSTPGDQKERVVAEGKYTVDPLGNVTFTPNPGVTGTVTPIQYTVRDSTGTTSNPATLSVTVGPATRGDVTGVVFRDDNGNGTQDAGEPGISNVSVLVTNGSFTQTAVTDSSGKYVAVGVPAGTTTVDVVESTLPAGFVATVATADPSSVTVVAGQSNDAGVDGYRPKPPLATGDTATTPLNTPVTIPVLGNDSASGPNTLDPSSVRFPTAGQPAGSTVSPDGKTITVPGEGQYEIQSDGTVRFTPEPGFTGTTTPVRYTVNDNRGQPSNPAPITVNVGAPTKGDVTGTIFQDTNGNGTQDAGEPGLPGVSVIVTNGSFTQTVVTDSSGKYTAVGVPVGTATVDVVDSTLPAGVTQTAGTDPSSVTVVAGQTANAGIDGYRPNPPVAVNDSASTPANTPVTLPLLGNDSASGSNTLDPSSVRFPTDGQPAGSTVSPDGKTLTIPGQGVFEIQPDGTVKFTPEAGFTGPVSPIKYTVNDSAGNPSNPATINVTVGPVGTLNGVVFRDDNGNGVKDASEPGLPGVQVKVTNPAGFDQTVTTDSSGTYTVPNVPLGDVTVDVVDSTLPTGATQTAGTDPNVVTVVAGNNDAGTDGYRLAPPKANDDSRTTPLDTPVTFTITGNDTASNPYNIVPSTVDLDPATPGVQTSRTVPEGTYVVNGVGEVTFTPNPGFSGKVTEITYTVLDSSGQKSNDGKINVTVLPTSSDDTATTPQGVPVDINVLGNDKGNIDPATVKVKTPPANGSAVVNPDGTIKYTPRTGFSGTDTFTYEVCDTAGSCTTSTVTVTVTPRPSGSLSGKVFEDSNGNSSLEPTEPGIPGAKVELFELKPDGTPDFTKPIRDANGNPLTATTDANGNYTFPSVPPGPVSVRVTDPAGKVLTTNNNPQTVTIQPSLPNTAAPVGYVTPKINLTLTPDVTVVTPGDNLPYTAVVTNNTPGTNTPLNDPVFTVTLPKGVVFDPSKPVTVDGVAVPPGNVTVKPDPTDPSRQILVVKLPAPLENNDPQTIKFNTIVTPAVDPKQPLIAVGEATGTASNGSTTVSVSSGAVAAAAVKVNLGVFSNETIILGRVYFDNNDNNNFDAGDVPLPGARVYLSDGRYAVTDKDGRYSIPNVAPGTYAVRLDPVTAPYTVKPVPDDQGAPGTRYVRAADAGGITNEDFLLSPPKGAAVKSRSTTVQRGPVRLSKVITQGGAGYAVTYTITITQAVRNLSITDPLPAGATRGPVTGATLEGNILRFPGVTQPGTYTVTFALFTPLPPDLALTDPDILFEQIFTLIPSSPGGDSSPPTNRTAPSGEDDISDEVIR